MEVTLAKALKLKNQVAGKLTSLQMQVTQRNRILEINKDAYNVRAKFEEAQQLQTSFVKLKQAIAVANGPIQATIVELAETKALLTYYVGISTDVSITHSYDYNGNPVEQRYHVTITEAEKEQLVKQCEKRIVDLQDELDAFNATHKVVVDDSLLA